MPAAELEAFQRGLQRIDATRNRMEQLFLDGKVRKTDIETIYEALFLRTVTGFENFLEQLFYAIMLNKAPTVRATSMMAARSRPALEAILLNGSNYLDWLPYSKTVGRANVYLKDGRPFATISASDQSQIKTVTRIRNAIAHRSDYAMAEFRNKVIGGRLLLPSEKRPAGYLRSQVRANPRQVRFEVYAAELARIAGMLC